MKININRVVAIIFAVIGFVLLINTIGYVAAIGILLIMISNILMN